MAFALVGLTGCGGTSSDVVAQVGSTPITKAMVGHWMHTLAGLTYYELSHHALLPPGLVSEPPNDVRCAHQLEVHAAPASDGVTKPTTIKLVAKCRQLNQQFRLLAISYLVNRQWYEDVLASLGVRVNEGEVLATLRQIKAREYPTEADFHEFLALRRWDLADELSYVRQDVLYQKGEGKMIDGDKFTPAYLEAARHWTGLTQCSSGAVVQHCKEYKGEPKLSSPSAAVLTEQVSAIINGFCINKPACANQ
jgi:hypothetical protein